jgi:hypothetical protein
MASDTDALQFWLFRLSSSLVSSCPTNISRKSERLISLLKRPGRDLSELFSDAADATTNVMIDNIEAIQPRETRQIELSNDKLDMLLFDLLQELIFLKDAERSRWESRPYAPVATERWSSHQIECRCSRVSVRRVNRAYNRGLRFAQRSGYSVMGVAVVLAEAGVLASFYRQVFQSAWPMDFQLP